MAKKFEWHRLHKYEENLDNKCYEEAWEIVTENYGVDEIEQLTEDMINEIETFQNTVNEFSPYHYALQRIINDFHDNID